MRLHVYPLDAVRFFAAFGVLAFHLAFYVWAAPTSGIGGMYEHAAAYPYLAPWTWFGWVGVEVFFVISGFVIANSANNASPIAFAKGRVLRLYPAAWVGALITLVAWMAIDGETWSELSRQFMHSITLWMDGPWIDGVYWTLAVEMGFYALIFTLLLARQFAHLPWAAGALLVYSGGFLLVEEGFGAALQQYEWWWTLRAYDGVLLLRYGCFFAVGMLMWLSSVRRLSALEWMGIGFGLICCCVEIYTRVVRLAAGEVQVHMTMAPAIPIGLWLAVVLMMFMFAQSPERFTPRTRGTQALVQHLGKMTYPLYLTHAVVGAGLMRLLSEAGLHRWLALGIAATAMLALASLIASVAEPGIRKALRAGWERLEDQLRRAPAVSVLFRSGGAVAEGR